MTNIDGVFCKLHTQSVQILDNYLIETDEIYNHIINGVFHKLQWVHIRNKPYWMSMNSKS